MDSKRSQWHVTLLGQEPDEDQRRLYDAFPASLGYSDRTLNEKRFEAVVLLAMALTRWSNRVLLLAPPSQEKWVLEKFDAVVDLLFKRCAQMGGDRVNVAKRYEEMFKRIFIAGKLLQMPEEPAQWVAFGFSTDDVLPEWMPRRLLP
jgi:hypothetical protein